MKKTWNVEVCTESKTIKRFDEKTVIPKIGECITVAEKWSTPKAKYRVKDVIHHLIEYYDDEIDITVLVDEIN